MEPFFFATCLSFLPIITADFKNCRTNQARHFSFSPAYGCILIILPVIFHKRFLTASRIAYQLRLPSLSLAKPHHFIYSTRKNYGASLKTRLDFRDTRRVFIQVFILQ